MSPLFLVCFLGLIAQPESLPILSKNLLMFVGKFLEPSSAPKMKQIHKSMSRVAIYEDVSSEMKEFATILQHVETQEFFFLKKIPTDDRDEWFLSGMCEGFKQKNWNQFSERLMGCVESCDALPVFSRDICHCYKCEISKSMLYFLIEKRLTCLQKMLRFVSQRGQDKYKLARLLVRQGVDLNCPTTGLAPVSEHNVPLLHSCIISQDEKFCKFLLENGANVNVLDHFNYTPLLYLVEFIICDTTVLGRYYRTEIMLRFLKLFFNYGADFEVLNSTHQTAIEQAMNLLRAREKKEEKNYGKNANM